MSIVSVAEHRLLNGEDPLTVFREAKTQVDAWITGSIAKLPPAAQPMLQQLSADVKQGISDLAGGVEDLLPGLLATSAPVIDDAFAALATSYLGPSLGGALSKAEVDGLNRIESALINKIKSAKLTAIAAATGAAAAPPQKAA